MWCVYPLGRFFPVRFFCRAVDCCRGREMAYRVAEFSNKEDMTRAVRELDDTTFADRRIRVDYVSTRYYGYRRPGFFLH